MKDSFLKKAAEKIASGRHIAALSGAGLSVESGIPPFRGKGGLWEVYNPMEYATIDAFLRNPKKVWEVLLMAMIDTLEKAVPGRGHLGLATLESLNRLKTVITQNVDGLHQMAGSTDVIEFHGSFAAFHCMDCAKQGTIKDLDLTTLPPRCSCGGIYRPEVVFFGEMIPSDQLWRSRKIAERCDIMMVVGTSATVQPAADLPIIAKRTGAVIIEVNPESTPLTHRISDIFLKGEAGIIMDDLVSEVKRRI